MRPRRTFDIIFSLLFLIPTLVLVLAMALLMCWDSQGCPIFWQRRVGKNSKSFWMLKIRTMRKNLDSKGDGIEDIAVNLDDPRITPAGRFLRRYHLDELPQILNILLGDMSLLGPRPMTEKIVEARTKLTPRYEERHTIRPGLFGLAQLKGTEIRLPNRHLDQLALDLFYIQNQCFELDWQIALATIKLIVFGKTPRLAFVSHELAEPRMKPEPMQEAA
ncbi:MAG: sugar transferase [bacterium]|nr:sugar transferase [bacterium]